MLRLLPIVFSGLMASAASAATFQIDVNFSGATKYQSLFEDAANFWESQIVGRWNGFDFGALQIDASVVAIDGAGGTLAGAAPQFGICSNGTGNLNTCRAQNEFVFTTSGVMIFDEADVDNAASQSILDDIIRHEMAHVIGFGTLWGLNGVYIPPDRDSDNNGSDDVFTDGEYKGTYGLAAYQQEFDPNATFVPVEGDGGAGTADSHWDENWAGGSADLMTGFLGGEQTTLSNTTLQSFRDIGYVLAQPSSVPLPASGMFLMAAIGVFATLRRKPK